MSVLADALWGLGIAGASAALTVVLLAWVSTPKRNTMRYDINTPTTTLSEDSVECLRCGWIHHGGSVKEQMAEFMDHMLIHEEAAP